MKALANCGCVYHAEQGIPCQHDLALEAREFEIDFIAATFMFGGLSYEEARIKAVKEWKEANADS